MIRSRSFRRGLGAVLLLTVAVCGAGAQMLPRVEGGWLNRTSLPELWGEGRTVAAITYCQGSPKPGDRIIDLYAPVVVVSESGAVAWSARAREGLPGPPFYRKRVPPETVQAFLAELRESGFTGSAHNRYQHCIPCAQVVTVIVDDGTSVIAVSTSKSLTVFGQPAVGGTSTTLTTLHPAKAPDDPDAYVEALIARFLPLAAGGTRPLDDLRFGRRRFEYVVPLSR